MPHGKGDPTGASNEPLDAETIEHIKALMEKGIDFYMKAECSAAIWHAIRRGKKDQSDRSWRRSARPALEPDGDSPRSPGVAHRGFRLLNG